MGVASSRSRYRLSPINGENLDNLPWIASPTSVIPTFNENSFTNLIAVGKGKFGFVFLSNVTNTSLCVAIKYIAKDFIMETKSVERISQTGTCIALVLEYAAGGELYSRLKHAPRFSEEEAKFYFCEISYALKYLHNEKNIVYRDLKPENILIDHNGHVKICDFGFAVISSHDKKDPSHKLKDTCGTAMYIAPEVINGQKNTFHNFPVDWWALGCITYEMIIGIAPFGDTETLTKFQVFDNILKIPLNLPPTISPELRTVIQGLLNKDQNARSSWKEVIDCDWLVDVNWDFIRDRRIKPPWKPKINSRKPDTSNFVSWPGLTLPKSKPLPQAEKYCVPLCKPSLFARGGERERELLEDDVRSMSSVGDGSEDTTRVTFDQSRRYGASVREEGDTGDGDSDDETVKSGVRGQSSKSKSSRRNEDRGGYNLSSPPRTMNGNRNIGVNGTSGSGDSPAKNPPDDNNSFRKNSAPVNSMQKTFPSKITQQKKKFATYSSFDKILEEKSTSGRSQDEVANKSDSAVNAKSAFAAFKNSNKVRSKNWKCEDLEDG